MVLGRLLGNAKEINSKEIKEEFKQILSPGEEIRKSYKLIRDLFVFTNFRLILVNKQGLTGKKKEYHSIPYDKISHFSIETSGNFDFDSELKIWISGISQPIQKKFNKKINIYEVQKVLSDHIFKNKK